MPIKSHLPSSSTARSAHDLGYNLVFVSDGMTDHDAEVHRHSVENVFPRIGEMATTDEVLELLNNRGKQER